MNQAIDLYERISIPLGLVCIGAAMAWTVSLTLLQDAGIAAGVFPQPGAQVMGGMYKQNPLWQAALTLQDLANASVVIAAVLLLSGAYLDSRRHEDEVVTA